MELLSRVQLTRVKTSLIKELKHTKSEDRLDKIRNKLEMIEDFISNNFKLE